MAYHHGGLLSIEERKLRLGLSEETPLDSAVDHHDNILLESYLPSPKKQKSSKKPKSSLSSARHKGRQRRMTDKPPVAPKPDILKNLPPAPKPRKRTASPMKPMPYKQHKEIKEKAISTFKSDQPVTVRLLSTEPHQKPPQRPPRKFSQKGKPSSDFYTPSVSPRSPIQYGIPEVPVKPPVGSRPRLDTPQDPPDPEAVANSIPQVNSPKRPKRSKLASSTIDSRPRLGTPSVPPEPTLISTSAAAHTNGGCSGGATTGPVTADGALYVEAYGQIAQEDELEVEYSTVPETRGIPTPSNSSGISSHSPTPPIPTPTPPPPDSEYSITSHVVESRKNRFRSPPPLPPTMEDTGAEEYALLDRPDRPVLSPIPPAHNYSSLDIPDGRTGFPGQNPTQQKGYSELEIPQDPTQQATLAATEGYEVLRPDFPRKVPRLTESDSVEEGDQTSFPQPMEVQSPRAIARKTSLKLQSGDLKLQESRDRSALPTYNSSEMDYQPAAKPVSFQRPPPPKPRHQRSRKPRTNGIESQTVSHSNSVDPDSHSSSADGHEPITTAPVCCSPPLDEPSLEEVGYETWRTFSPPAGDSDAEGLEERKGEGQAKAMDVEKQDGSTSEVDVVTSPKCMVDIDHVLAVQNALRSRSQADSRRYENQEVVDAFRRSGSSTVDNIEAGSKDQNAGTQVLAGAVHTLEEVDLSTVERSSAVDELGYCEVDIAETLEPESTSQAQCSTVNHSTIVTDALGYCEVDVPDQTVPEKEPEAIPRVQDTIGLSSGKCSPVITDAHEYCELDVPDTFPPQVKPKPLLPAVDLKHSSSVTDARGCCELDVPDTTPPPVKPKPLQPTVDISTVEHSSVVTDARGYCELDVPDPSPPPVKPKRLQQAVDISTVEHSSVVTDARGLDVPDPSPPPVKPKPLQQAVDLSTAEHSSVVTDAHGYCDLDVPEPSLVFNNAREYCEIDLSELPKPKPRLKSRKARAGSRGDSVSSETDIPASPLASLSTKSPERANSQPQQTPEKQHQKETLSEPKGSPKVSSERKVLGPPRRKAPPPPIKIPPSSRQLPPLPRLPTQHSRTAGTETSTTAAATAKTSEPIAGISVEELKKVLSVPKPVSPIAKGGGRFTRAKSRSIHVARPTPKTKVPASPREDSDVDMSSKDPSPGLGRKLKGLFKKNRDREEPVTLLSVTIKAQSLPRVGHLPQVHSFDTAASEEFGIYSTIPEPDKEEPSPQDDEPPMDEDLYTVVDLPVQKKKGAQAFAMRRSASNEHLYESTEYDKIGSGSGARSASNSPLVQHRTQDQFSKSLPTTHPIATLPRRGKKPRKNPPKVDVGQLYATVTKPRGQKDKEQLPPLVGANPVKSKIPPVVPTKPQTKVKTKARPLPAVSAEALAESKLQDQMAPGGQHAVEEFVITSVDEKLGRVASQDEDSCIPSSEIVHTVSVGGEQYAVVNVKPRRRSKPDGGLAEGTEPQVGLAAAYGNGTAKDQDRLDKELAQDTAVDGSQSETPLQGTGSKPAVSHVGSPPSKPPRGPRNPPPKPIPYIRDGLRGDLSQAPGSTVAPPVPTSDRPKPTMTDRATSTTTLEGSLTKVGVLGEVFRPPSHPPPPPPTSPLPPLPTSPTPTSPPPFPPQLSPSERARMARLSTAGPPSFPPPPPPLLTAASDPLNGSEEGGIVDHTYEVPSDLLEGHTQVPNVLDLEVENPEREEGMFSPDETKLGYEVVATKNGVQNNVSASDVQMVFVDESSVQDTAQVQRPPHLYAVVPEMVEGGGEGEGGGERSVAVPMRQPHLYEAVDSSKSQKSGQKKKEPEMVEGGGEGEGGGERSVAVPMRQPHLYEAVDSSKSQKSGQKKKEPKFPQLKPKTKPPPAPPPGKKPKPAEPALNPSHQQVSSPSQEANPLLGKRITVAYREGDEAVESVGVGQPLFLFPSSRSQRFIAVGQRDGSDSTPSPSISCSTLSTFDDDSDAYSTEWDTSSGEEEEEQEVGPPRPKTFYIAQEVLTTERTFVKGLALLHKDFRQTMLSANRAHEKPVISEETLKQILGNIGSLLALNAGMLQELEERMTDWDTDPRIGDVLLVRAPYLKLYSEYISKFDKALKMLEEVTKKNPLFAEVLHEFEAQPKCANLPLAGYMLEIVQRIPRYKMLLSDYVKHLPEDAADRPPSEKALEIISSVASHVNETIRQMDNFRKVVEVRKKLIGDTGDTLITPYRKLLKEGELVKFSRKEKQPRMFFLFNDIVIYASYIPPANTTYKVIKRIPLDGMRVEPLDDPDLRHGFQIISTCKSFRLEASNGEDRQQWITAFNTAIREHNERIQSRQSIRRTHAADNVGDETDSVPLGHFAPPWLPDSSVSMCQLCSVQFTVTRRRHHCRGCGMIFCGECSQYLAPLRYKNNKLGRVCQTCYEKISQDDRGGGGGGGEEVDGDGEKSPKRLSRLQRSQKLVNMPSVLTEVKARDQNAQISGYLLVHTSKTRRWRRKWFVVYNLVLYEFERHEDVTAKRSITLPSYQVISPVPRHDDPQVFCLRHPGAGKWYFKADREEQLERWIDVLQKAVRGETGEEIGPVTHNVNSPSPEHET